MLAPGFKHQPQKWTKTRPHTQRPNTSNNLEEGAEWLRTSGQLTDLKTLTSGLPSLAGTRRLAPVLSNGQVLHSNSRSCCGCDVTILSSLSDLPRWLFNDTCCSIDRGCTFGTRRLPVQASRLLHSTPAICVNFASGGVSDPHCPSNQLTASYASQDRKGSMGAGSKDCPGIRFSLHPSHCCCHTSAMA